MSQRSRKCTATCNASNALCQAAYIARYKCTMQMHSAIQRARQCTCGVLLHDLEGVGLVACGAKYKVRAAC